MTLKQLRSRDYDNVDWDNLLDEIEDLSRHERQDLAINLVFVLRHLLKWQFHDGNHTGTVASSITEHRWRVLRLLKDSPSLNSLPNWVKNGAIGTLSIFYIVHGTRLL